jgi:hypothetical protein
MRLIPNFAQNPVLQALIDVVQEDTRLHGAYATHSQRANGCHHVDPRSWVAKIETALAAGDATKIEQIRLARREALLPFISARFSAHRAFRQVVGHRSAICAAIAQAFALIDDKDKSVTEDLKAAVGNNILMAQAAHHRQDADTSFNWQDFGRALQDECHDALSSAYADLAEGRTTRPTRGYDQTGSHDILHVYTTDPVIKPNDIGEDSRREEVRRLNMVAFDDCVNSAHPALAQLVALSEQLAAAMKDLWTARDYMRQNEKGRVNERQYAERLMAQVTGSGNKTDCRYAGEGKDKNALSLPEQQTALRRDYESARCVIGLALQQAILIRMQLAEALKAAIDEVNSLTAKPKEYTMSIRPQTIDRIEAGEAGMINCLSVDLQLRETGRSLLEAIKEHKDDITQGRGKTALQAAIDAARRQYVRKEIA